MSNQITVQYYVGKFKTPGDMLKSLKFIQNSEILQKSLSLVNCLVRQYLIL